MVVDRRALADPRFLLATAVLLANDHWWKAAHGNWVTGKVSDIAGLLMAGVLVRVVFADRAPGRISLVALAAWFTAMKTVPVVTAATVALADGLTPWANTIATDPTDLLALPVLFGVAAIVERPRPLPLGRSLRVAAFVVAASAAVATSQPEPDYGDDLRLDDSGEIIATPYYRGDDPELTRQACRPTNPDLCFRLRGGLTIDESIDGGRTWLTVWQIDVDAAPTFRTSMVTALYDYELGPSDIVASDDAVVASFDGLSELVGRDSSGRWTPAPADFRAIPWGGLVALGLVSVLTATALAASMVRSGRHQAQGAVFAGVAALCFAVAAWIAYASMHAVGGVFPVELFVTIPVLPLVIVCGLALMEPTRLWRSLAPTGRVLLGVVLFTAVVAPPIALQRWSATGSPDYRPATAIAALVAIACVALAPLIAWRFSPAGTLPSSMLPQPPDRPPS